VGRAKYVVNKGSRLEWCSKSGSSDTATPNEGMPMHVAGMAMLTCDCTRVAVLTATAAA
jgi:hypothetical protein